MGLDRLLRHEQCLGDRTVGHTFGRHASDATLCGGQGLGTELAEPPGFGSYSHELLMGSAGDGPRTSAERDFDGVPQWLTGLGTKPGPALRTAQRDPGVRLFERRLTDVGRGHCLSE
jgi:hypothetical protein